MSETAMDGKMIIQAYINNGNDRMNSHFNTMMALLLKVYREKQYKTKTSGSTTLNNKPANTTKGYELNSKFARRKSWIIVNAAIEKPAIKKMPNTVQLITMTLKREGVIVKNEFCIV